jgi:hypothetical protein
MTGVVVVRKHFPFCHNLPNQLHPTSQVVRPVDNGLVPSLGLQFDSLSVTEPSDISEVGRYQVERFLEFPRARHATAGTFQGKIRAGN